MSIHLLGGVPFHDDRDDGSMLSSPVRLDHIRTFKLSTTNKLSPPATTPPTNLVPYSQMDNPHNLFFHQPPYRIVPSQQHLLHQPQKLVTLSEPEFFSPQNTSFPHHALPPQHPPQSHHLQTRPIESSFTHTTSTLSHASPNSSSSTSSSSYANDDSPISERPFDDSDMAARCNDAHHNNNGYPASVGPMAYPPHGTVALNAPSDHRHQDMYEYVLPMNIQMFPSDVPCWSEKKVTSPLDQLQIQQAPLRHQYAAPVRNSQQQQQQLCLDVQRSISADVDRMNAIMVPAVAQQPIPQAAPPQSSHSSPSPIDASSVHLFHRQQHSQHQQQQLDFQRQQEQQRHYQRQAQQQAQQQQQHHQVDAGYGVVPAASGTWSAGNAQQHHPATAHPPHPLHTHLRYTDGMVLPNGSSAGAPQVKHEDFTTVYTPAVTSPTQGHHHPMQTAVTAAAAAHQAFEISRTRHDPQPRTPTSATATAAAAAAGLYARVDAPDEYYSPLSENAIVGQERFVHPADLSSNEELGYPDEPQAVCDPRFVMTESGSEQTVGGGGSGGDGMSHGMEIGSVLDRNGKRRRTENVVLVDEYTAAMEEQGRSVNGRGFDMELAEDTQRFLDQEQEQGEDADAEREDSEEEVEDDDDGDGEYVFRQGRRSLGTLPLGEGRNLRSRSVTGARYGMCGTYATSPSSSWSGPEHHPPESSHDAVAGACGDGLAASPSPSQRRRVRQAHSLPVPIPVPNLTKKSRGRRVPTISSIEHGGRGGRRSTGVVAAAASPAAAVLSSAGSASAAGGDVDAKRAKGTRTYTCKVRGCGKCFARGEHLKRHVRSIHTYEKPHKCPYPSCGKDFSRHDNLGQHMRVHKDYVPPPRDRDGSSSRTSPAFGSGGAPLA